MRDLHTVEDLLEALKEENDWPSDYAIGKELGINQTTISAWRTGRAAPRENHALLIAEALKISPVLVLAIVAAERSSDKKSRDDWTRVARHLAKVGLPAIAALTLWGPGTEPAPAFDRSIDYTHRRRRPAQPQPA
jgi:transcriptional regulator with XRE-family HTH domain